MGGGGREVAYIWNQQRLKRQEFEPSTLSAWGARGKGVHATRTPSPFSVSSSEIAEENDEIK